jgi:outer membrane receptor protein involved in Fe transport
VTQTLTSDNGLALYTPVAIGQMLPDAPKLSGSYLVTYEHRVRGSLRLYGQINDHYQGAEHPYLADPTFFGRGHSLGLRIGFRNPVERWDTSIWATNLTDTRPLTYAFAGSEGQQASQYQKPRSIGVNITHSF